MTPSLGPCVCSGQETLLSGRATEKVQAGHAGWQARHGALALHQRLPLACWLHEGVMRSVACVIVGHRHCIASTAAGVTAACQMSVGQAA